MRDQPTRIVAAGYDQIADRYLLQDLLGEAIATRLIVALGDRSATARFRADAAATAINRKWDAFWPVPE